MNRSRSLAPIFIFFLAIILIGGLVWADFNLAQWNIAGDGFSIQWISIQSLAKSGSSPYSDEVTTQLRENIQVVSSFIVGSSPYYIYPLYSGFVIFPFTLIGDKTLAHAIWLTAQLCIIFAMIIIALRLTGWKPVWYIFFLFSLFTIFSYHIVIPWQYGGLTVWSAFFILVALLAIGDSRYETGGVFLALASIQPQLVLLPTIFIVIWAISKKRNTLILWFFITLILLSAIGLFLVPDWIIQYLRLLYKFLNNLPPGTPSGFFRSMWPGLGKQVGWLIMGSSGLVLLIEWFLALKKDHRWFLWTVSLTMVISLIIGIPVIPGNFVELILPLVLISAMLTERWSRAGPWVAVFITILLFIWEWMLYYKDVSGSTPGNQLNLIFPLPAVLLIGLYWVRWWAVKPRHMLIEELRLSET